MNDTIQYASDIVELSMKADYDTNTIMNGLAIATASMLLDNVIADASFKVNEAELNICVDKYIATLYKALDFAKSQLAEARLAVVEE